MCIKTSLCETRFLITVFLILFIVQINPSLVKGQSILQHPYIDNIIKNVLPRKFPLLLKYAKTHPEFTVKYTTGSNEIQTLKVIFKEGTLIISGLIHGQSQSIQGGLSVIITMFDSNLDSKIDFVTYKGESVPGGHYSQKNPTDDTTLFTWYTGLNAVIRFSRCC